MLRSAAVVLFLSLMAGCASVPVDIEKAPRAQSASIIDPSVLANAPDRGLVRVVRDGGAYHSAMAVLVYVDGRHVANIESNRVLELRVPAGTRKVGFQINDVSQPIQYEDISVMAGHTYDFRVSVSAGGIWGDWKFERLN
ncbi:hypothetical protein ABE485_06355 [Achromobacter spanius]|uniref:hypothetical protein n=1 Tax=Achromobacter spanius TaxID=217203 RepID=UPI003208E910